MNYEYEIDKLKKAVANLNNTVLQMAKNNTPMVSKVDNTANIVTTITPYTETKTAYIGDTEVVFDNVPNGCVGVFINGVPDGCVARYEPTDRVVIHFDEPLEEVTEVTISIQ